MEEVEYCFSCPFFLKAGAFSNLSFLTSFSSAASRSIASSFFRADISSQRPCCIVAISKFICARDTPDPEASELEPSPPATMDRQAARRVSRGIGKVYQCEQNTLNNSWRIAKTDQQTPAIHLNTCTCVLNRPNFLHITSLCTIQTSIAHACNMQITHNAHSSNTIHVHRSNLWELIFSLIH